MSADLSYRLLYTHFLDFFFVRSDVCAPIVVIDYKTGLCAGNFFYSAAEKIIDLYLLSALSLGMICRNFTRVGKVLSRRLFAVGNQNDVRACDVLGMKPIIGALRYL